MADRVLRLGVAGLGRAFSVMLATFAGDRRVRLVAAADPRPEARQKFAADFGGRTYATVEQLCADADIDVVYVATPHQDHARHAMLAAEHGRHALVEKPMALTLDDAGRMIAAARRAGTLLLVGHSHSFDTPILRAREIIASGVFGRPRMITALNFTDFLYRPRRPEELATAQGGGVVFNQAPHQIDIVRLLGGGLVRSVRAFTGAWDRQRPTEGAYTALLGFDDGLFASAVYNGYAHFDSDEFAGWIGELGQRKDASAYGAARASLLQATEESALKLSRSYGGARFASADHRDALHQHFGEIVVSCDHADLRPLPTGVMIYGDREARLDALPPPTVPRAEVIDELHGAVVLGKPAVHDGAWALATLEVCLGILQSARDGGDVAMRHQVGLP